MSNSEEPAEALEQEGEEPSHPQRRRGERRQQNLPVAQERRVAERRAVPGWLELLRALRKK
jgi:hypothetical protein